MRNKGIENKLDAWLSFFCMDAPEEVKLITAYQEFGPMYEDAYELCRSTERMMDMFSKELLELDRNTAAYMVDVMQKEIDDQKQALDEQKHEISEQKQALDEKQQALDEQRQEIDAAHARIAELEALLEVTE